MATSLEIARAAVLKPVSEIAAQMGIGSHLLEHYGDHVAKVKLAAIEELRDRPRARYVVVSGMTPTPLGEGKTTTAIGLGQAMGYTGRRATVSIRQGSMGPTFGIKGAAAGGGYSQAAPFEALALHFTGDLHAVTAANNMLAAIIDNHLYRGSATGLVGDTVTWRRAIDVNDRGLRKVTTGVGGGVNGIERDTGFDITAASEVMAVLAMATSLGDLRERLGRIVVGFAASGEPVTAEHLRGAGAMAVILRDAIKPNLVQTLENTPVLVHTGPFGNIAHGNSSVVADLLGVHGGEYLITEAGFAADMGAERFFNIKCRISGLEPDAAVVVATVRAMKIQSGRYHVVPGRPLPPALLAENPEDVGAGAANLAAHLAIIQRHGVTPVVAINELPGDFDSEHDAISEIADGLGVRSAPCRTFAEGGRGGVELADAVVEATEESGAFRFLYPAAAPLKDKIATIAADVYGAAGVDYSPDAEAQLDRFATRGLAHLPICVAKTQYSLSADPQLTGAPTGWRLPVREARASVGAGYIYLICGEISTMPGLGSAPAAYEIDLDDHGDIVGLY